MTARLTSGASALSLAGLLLLGAQTPASAQQADDPGRGSERCSATGGGPGNAPGNAPQYPPSRGGGVSDSSPSRGQQMNASSGCREFAPGQRVAYGVESVFQQLGTVLATTEGQVSASFVVPTNLPDGRHHVVFRGLGFNGVQNEVRLPFVVSGGPLTAAPGREAAPRDETVTVAGVDLPRTGSDEIVPLTALGLGLVAAGAGLVVVARRRATSSLA